MMVLNTFERCGRARTAPQACLVPATCLPCCHFVPLHPASGSLWGLAGQSGQPRVGQEDQEQLGGMSGMEGRPFW